MSKLSKDVKALPLSEQLKNYGNEKVIYSSRVEKFVGVDGFDVYNPSIPFELDGKTYIAGRVEKRDSEHSQIRIFEKKEDIWQVVDSKILNLQDPFISIIDFKIILGGVSVQFFETYAEWTTEFYHLKNLQEIDFIAKGPKFMKDIRLLQLSNKKIAVLSRPQGESAKQYNAIAKIGFTIIDKLEDLNEEVITNAPILEGQFIPTEWGGANQLYELSNGLIGVIGHKSMAQMIENKRYLSYCSMAFAINPNTSEVTQTKIFATRKDFPDTLAKRGDLVDVVFTSGIIRQQGAKARLYAGLSDAYVGSCEINDPLIEYEKIKI